MLAEAASAAGGVTLDVSAVSAPAIVVGADAAGRAVRPPGNDIWARVRLQVFYTERHRTTQSPNEHFSFQSQPIGFQSQPIGFVT